MVLDSIIVFVKDIDRVKPLYIDGLGLEIIEEQHSEWLLLNAGGCKIGLHKIGAEFENSKGLKNTKLSFEISESLEETRTKLLRMGIKMKEIKTFENYAYWLCDGEDLEGNVFQLKVKKT